MNLIEALVARSIPFRRSASLPDEISLCCIFCIQRGQTIDRKFRLGINIRNGKGHCFNCEWSSHDKAVELVSKELSLGVQQLAMPGAQIVKAEQARLEPLALPDDFVLLDQPIDKLYAKAYKYLKDRRVEEWQIREKRIGVSMTGRYAYRIVFPIFYGKKLQGIVTRDFTGQQEPKYMNTPGMKVIYNLPSKKQKRAVLCEGVFDCLSIERLLTNTGYDILALLGHTLTDTQRPLLDRYEEIILWPDLERSGIDGFMVIAKQLAADRHQVYVITPRFAPDAGEATRAELFCMWMNRARFDEGQELKLRAEVACRD